MKIEITKLQIEFIRKFLSQENSALLMELEDGKLDETHFELDEDQMDTLREWAIDKLLFLGFDDNYEVTEAGKILESLIDLFCV